MKNWAIEFLNNKDLMTFMSLFAIYSITYFLTSRATVKSSLSIDQQRRVLNNSKGLLLFVTLLSALIIWHSQIYSLIISLAALGAALVIATKELLLCLGGSFFRTSTRSFQIGDRIEINEIRGDVIDVGLFATQILEVGPGDLTHQYTGRAVNIPNSLFLSHKVINETYSDEYVLHIFKIPVKIDSDWERHQQILLELSRLECNQFIVDAQRHFNEIARKKRVESPIIEPRVTLKILTPETVTLVVRVTVPVRSRGRIEQNILINYLRQINHTKTRPHSGHSEESVENSVAHAGQVATFLEGS